MPLSHLLIGACCKISTTTSFCVLDITYLLLSQPPLSSPIDTDEMDREAEGREGRATCDSAAVKVIEPRKKHTHEGRVIRRVLVVTSE